MLYVNSNDYSNKLRVLLYRITVCAIVSKKTIGTVPSLVKKFVGFPIDRFIYKLYMFIEVLDPILCFNFDFTLYLLSSK